jgi:tRNA threonylcarbamoyladenosine biosynthesis protein TsaB
MSAVLLAFDTSTETLSVALQWPGGRQAWDGPGGALSSSALLPRIRALMDEAGIGWSDVSAIAFGRGPGAFTGLRTACAVAQGLAFGAGLPVLPIDSLMIVAEDARRQVASASPSRLDVAVAMDARMGQVYAARYLWDADACGQAAGWRTRVEPMLCDPPELPALWSPADGSAGPPDLMAGSGVALLGEDGVEGDGWGRVPSQPAGAGRAVALLQLADQAWREGRAVPSSQALPLYLRDKVALTSAERAALRDGAR